jgi:hypothetical protein
MMEKLVEWTVLAVDTEVLGENLPLRHFVHYKSHLLDTAANPGRRGGKPATNRFNYGAATTGFIRRLNYNYTWLQQSTLKWYLCNSTCKRWNKSLNYD